MPQNDVTIYATSAFSAGFYDRSRMRAGGAERQTTLLARALADRGHRVAHIIYPPRDPIALSNPRLRLVHREPYGGDRTVVGPLVEVRRIWRALSAADGAVTIVRTGSPLLGIVAVFCRLRRRRLIFSSANISDFTLETMRGRVYRALYTFGLRSSSVVVVQSQDQLALARRAIRGLPRVVHIPSFAEAVPASPGTAPTATPRAFLWVGRIVDYKQPMRYVDLARALPEASFVMIATPEQTDSGALASFRAAAEAVPNLELLDPRPHDQVLQAIRESVAVVNTSTLEGMPNMFLEAWTLGVPVLTLQFDPDGVVRRLELGRSAEGSWERFVAGARELWESRDRRETVGRRTRAYVEEVHSVEAVGGAWSELVSSLAHPH